MCISHIRFVTNSTKPTRSNLSFPRAKDSKRTEIKKKKKKNRGEKGRKEKWENVERWDKRINREGVENNCAGVPTEINRATTREINDPARINNASTTLLHRRFHEHHQRWPCNARWRSLIFYRPKKHRWKRGRFELSNRFFFSLCF